MANIQTNIRRKEVRLFILLFACFLILLPMQTALAEGSTVSVTLQVNQTFTQKGNPADPDRAFTYNLVALEDGNPMPAGSSAGTYSFEIEGTSAVDLGPITFTNTGVYNYEILIDESSQAAGYTLDEQVYIVSVYVKRVGADLVTEIIVKKNTDIKVNSIDFSNEILPLASDIDMMDDLKVKKTVSGTTSANSTFEFTLTAKDKLSPMPLGSQNGVKTITVTGSGEASFGVWQYTEAGTYFYTVAEKNTGESGYTYDNTVYTITDVVKEADGRLVLDRVVTNDSNKQVSAYIFINQYSPGIVAGPKTGDDALTTPYIVAIAVSSVVAIGCIYMLIKGRKQEAAQAKYQKENVFGR